MEGEQQPCVGRKDEDRSIYECQSSNLSIHTVCSHVMTFGTSEVRGGKDLITETGWFQPPPSSHLLWILPWDRRNTTESLRILLCKMSPSQRQLLHSSFTCPSATKLRGPFLTQMKCNFLLFNEAISPPHFKTPQITRALILWNAVHSLYVLVYRWTLPLFEGLSSESRV